MSEEGKNKENQLTISDVLKLFLGKYIIIYLPQGHKIKGKLSSIEKDHILLEREIGKFRLGLNHIALLDEPATKNDEYEDANLIILIDLPYPSRTEFPTTWTLTAKR